MVALKVHKNENFFGSDFEICTISLLVILKYYGFVKKFFDRAIVVGGMIGFLKFDRATVMAFCVSLGPKCQNLSA